MLFGNILEWKQLRDQPLHACWAAMAVFPVVYWGPHWWTGGLTGLLIDLPRELVDQWPLSRETDAPLDLAVFALAGALVGGLL